MKTWIAALMVGCLFTAGANAQDGIVLDAGDSEQATPAGDLIVAPIVTLTTAEPTEFTTVTPYGSGWRITTQEYHPLGIPLVQGPDTIVVPGDVIAELPTPPVEDGSQDGSAVTTKEQDSRVPIAVDVNGDLSFDSAGTDTTTDVLAIDPAILELYNNYNGALPIAAPPVSTIAAQVDSTIAAPPAPAVDPVPQVATPTVPLCGLDSRSIPQLPDWMGGGKPTINHSGGTTIINVVNIIVGDSKELMSSAGLAGPNSPYASMFGGKYLSGLVNMALDIADRVSK